MSDQFVVGDIKTIVITTPGAGNNFSYTVPAGIRLRILGITYHIATDANVASRRPALYVLDPNGGNSFFAVAQATIAANANVDVSFAPSNRDMPNVRSGFLTVPLASEIILKPGDVLSSNIISMQAGDELTETYILVESFLLP